MNIGETTPLTLLPTTPSSATSSALITSPCAAFSEAPTLRAPQPPGLVSVGRGQPRVPVPCVRPMVVTPRPPRMPGVLPRGINLPPMRAGVASTTTTTQQTTYSGGAQGSRMVLTQRSMNTSSIETIDGGALEPMVGAIQRPVNTPPTQLMAPPGDTLDTTIPAWFSQLTVSNRAHLIPETDHGRGTVTPLVREDVPP